MVPELHRDMPGPMKADVQVQTMEPSDLTRDASDDAANALRNLPAATNDGSKTGEQVVPITL